MRYNDAAKEQPLMSWNQQPSTLTADARDARITAFLARVYGWMFLGLLVTTTTAFVVASSPLLWETLVRNRPVFWILMFGQLALVWYLSAKVQDMSPATAGVLFM